MVLLIVKMVAQEFTVDFSKPLVFQACVVHTYFGWSPWRNLSGVGSPASIEQVKSSFFTRTVWWAVPTIWLPVACWCISMSIHMGHTLPQTALMVGFGMFVWTFLEYCFHRFLFHIETKSYWGNTVHYLLHGCHHKHPMDGLRLVIPPAEATLLAIMLLFTPSSSPALFGGGLIGYVMYDVIHYYVHHGQPTTQVPKSLKKYHLNHHFRIQNMGFGITWAFWDTVFGTFPQTKVAEKTR
ncbi:hypothetical protein CRYUN_Cryun32bG0000400 [Craigia yunnanensis]